MNRNYIILGVAVGIIAAIVIYNYNKDKAAEEVESNNEERTVEDMLGSMGNQMRSNSGLSEVTYNV